MAGPGMGRRRRWQTDAMRTYATRRLLAALTFASAPFALAACGAGAPGRPLGGPSVIAYWASGTHESLANLPGARHVITAVAPFSESVEPDGSVNSQPSGSVYAVSRQANVAVTPLFNSPGSQAFLEVASARARAVSQIAAVLKAGAYPGLHIDFEPPHTRYTAGLTAFMTELRHALPHAAIYLDVVPASGGAYEWSRLAPLVTGFCLMAYDRHSSGTAPGPVAPTPWVRASLQNLIGVVPASKVLVSLASYGYAWPGGSTTAATLPLMAIPAAALHASHYDGASQEMTASYSANGTSYTAWWESLKGIAAKVRMAKSMHLAGVCVWRLGYDTPQLWKTIATNL